MQPINVFDRMMQLWGERKGVPGEDYVSGFVREFRETFEEAQSQLEAEKAAKDAADRLECTRLIYVDD